MGLPGIFSWCTKNFKQDKFVGRSINSSVDYFYLDTNCLIHPQCYKILELCTDVKILSVLEKKMFARIVNYIEYLIGLVQPKEMVYIGIDGVAPMAKMNQQRKRRFRTIDDNEIKNEIKTRHKKEINKIWDNTTITPGTEFMEKLHKHLLNYFKKKKDLKYKLKYIYSSYHTPGEGEHKILRHIKKNITNESTAVIYGLDADLIFLSLASQKSNIYLLREASIFRNQPGFDMKDYNYDPINDVAEEQNFVSIDNLKCCFVDQIVKLIEYKTRNKIVLNNNDKISFSNDFIFICYLLGNDFLPHFPSIDIKKGGLDIIFDVYVDIYLLLKINIIKLQPEISINMDFLELLLEKLGDYETEYFTEIVPDYNYRFGKRRCMERDKYLIELWNLENMKNDEAEDPIKLGKGKKADWKYRYYAYYFGVAEHQSDHVDNMCKAYLSGLAWVTKYYFSECPSWKWQYVYTHAPFISDVANYIKKTNFDINDIKFEYFGPVTPMVQLLSVLPPNSNNLLPISYRNLVISDDSPIIDLFPKKVKLDKIGKSMYWMCVPMIPCINIDRILNTVNKLKLTELEKERNSILDDYE